MAFGVEVRNPFLDYRLVEFAMGIPDESPFPTHNKSGTTFSC